MQFKTTLLIPAFTLLQIGGVTAVGNSRACKARALRIQPSGSTKEMYLVTGPRNGNKLIPLCVSSDGTKFVFGTFDHGCEFHIKEGKTPRNWKVYGSVHLGDQPEGNVPASNPAACRVEVWRDLPNGSTEQMTVKTGPRRGEDQISLPVNESETKFVYGRFNIDCKFTIEKGKKPRGWHVDGYTHQGDRPQRNGPKPKPVSGKQRGQNSQVARPLSYYP